MECLTSKCQEPQRFVWRELFTTTPPSAIFYLTRQKEQRKPMWNRKYRVDSTSGRQNWKPVELKAFIAGQVSSTQQLVILKWLKKTQPNHYFILRILKWYNLKLWNISIDDSGIWDSCHPPTMSPHPHKLKMKEQFPDLFYARHT